jgi:hypothetical protein
VWLTQPLQFHALAKLLRDCCELQGGNCALFMKSGCEGGGWGRVGVLCALAEAVALVPTACRQLGRQNSASVLRSCSLTNKPLTGRCECIKQVCHILCI